MNIALIIAGGRGERMHQDIPKQFLNVYDKPIIIYTLEVFQKHPDIDAIEVVCLDGWHEILWAYAKQFNISKLQWVVSGGENGQASARNGIFNLRDKCSADDLIVIHDGIRPLVRTDIISDCIAKSKIYGSAVAAISCQETIIKTTDKVSGKESIPRTSIMRVQTPQAYKFSKILWGHEEALRRGITNSVYANTMLVELGEEIYFSVGSDKNIKITSVEDLELFKALLSVNNESWIK